MIPIPNVQQRQEVRTVVGKLFVSLIGGLFLFSRTKFRALDLKCRRDDEHFSEATFAIGRENHLSDTRIDGKASQSTSFFGESLFFVDGSDFEKRFEPIANRFDTRRIDERKLFDVSQSQVQCLQYDGRQIRAADFWRSELLSRFVVFFGIQPHTNAGSDSTTTSAALIRRGLRNGFDRQSLHFTFRGVVADACSSGVDDAHDARHRDRGFSHVGCQHDSPSGFWREDFVLLAG